MSPPLSSDHFLIPFEVFDGEGDAPGGLSPSDTTDCISDWGADDFFVGRRSPASGSNEFSRAHTIGQEGLRIVESESETDTDEQIVAIGDSSLGQETDLPFCWECLHVVEDRSDPIEEFEWEDISDRADEREIFCLTAFADDNDDVENPNPDTEEGRDSEMSVDWEVLFSVNHDAETVFVEDQGGFAYTSEYEVLFGQLGDHGGLEWMKCSRPAARSVIENLPSVQLTADDIAKENIHCAVCKEEISLSEEVKALPCLHYYHEPCIVPWLVMRNTCPLCRYELPSGDPNDATVVGEEEEAHARYEFEILQAT